MKMQNLSTKKESNQSFRTPDLYLAAFLKIRGVILDGSERERGRTIFIFQQKDVIEGLIRDYYNDAAVPVLAYKGALRDLKAIIHGSREDFHIRDKMGEGK